MSPISSTFDVSNFDKLTDIKFLQFLNVSLIYFTDEFFK